MNRMFFCVTVIIVSLITFSSIWAGEAFRYKFDAGEVLPYKITIDSDLEILELGSLARMMNLDRMKHNASLEVNLLIDTVESNGNAAVEATFGRVSMVMVAGDSAYVDDGSNWGAIKSGSRYNFTMSPRGEIIAFSGPDSVTARQGAQMVQRFFPVFPDESIDSGFNWTDSISFELELPGEKPSEIISSMTYSFPGHRSVIGYLFDYVTNGSSAGDKKIRLSGNGMLEFDKGGGRLLENSGDFIIDSEVDLAAFGLPQGLGTVPIHIQSKIIIKLSDGE